MGRELKSPNYRVWIQRIHLSKNVFVLTSCSLIILNSSKSSDFSLCSWIWMILCRMGELFLVLGLTLPLILLSKLYLYISFCIAITFSKIAKISASACAKEFKLKNFSSVLNKPKDTHSTAKTPQVLLLGSRHKQWMLEVHSCPACTRYRGWACTTRRERL